MNNAIYQQIQEKPVERREGRRQKEVEVKFRGDTQVGKSRLRMKLSLLEWKKCGKKIKNTEKS